MPYKTRGPQGKRPKSARNARILLFDIENTPNLAYVWDKYQQDVIKFEREWNLMSVAWKWYGERTVHVAALADFPATYKRDPNDDCILVKILWSLFDKADIVVAHNGRDFDVRKTNARFLKHGCPPPSPYRIVDTKLSASKHFKFNSNSLKDLATYLGLPQKMETGGFGLWFSCMRGDLAAWAKMKKYNRQDVIVLEKVYERLLPWMDSHPNVTLGSEVPYACPRCGSREVERRGWTYMKSWRAQRFVCRPCGRWSKGPREKLPYGVLQ